MSGSPPDRCGYVYPPHHEVRDESAQQNGCWRKSAGSEETERCLWHADPDSVEKTVASLREARSPPEQTDQPIPDIRQQVPSKAELLDGVKTPGITFGKQFPFRNVSLREADLSDADLSDAKFWHADLSGAKIKDADLSGANLWRADLSGANLWRADLSDADVVNADLPNVDLRGADLPDADLRDADLLDVNLSDADLSDANLKDADLSGSNLKDVDLSASKLRGADLSGSNLRDADLTGSKLWGANFSGSNLRDADLTDADLRDADLTDANLRDADLTDADLRDANLTDANLRDANLTDANFRHADLTDANLQHASLSDAGLRDTDLSGANLSGANLLGANLSSANLSGANLESTTLTGIILRNATIEDVSIDGSTNCQSLAEGYDADRSIKNRYIQLLIRKRPRWWPSVGSSNLDASQWDATARAYHDLKSAFNDHGLVSKARHQHLGERGARRCEARAAKEKGSWLRSWIAWQLTGYGVSIRRIFRNMSIIFGVATLAYLTIEFIYPVHAINQEYANIPEIFYYSVITFTTTPPDMPDSTIIKAIVMTEAFFGTLLVVFLGYVLGTREQF